MTRIQLIDAGAARFEPARLEALRADYLSSLSAPMDGMWQAFAAMGKTQLFVVENEPAEKARDPFAGFCSVGDDGRLLQFFVAKPWLSEAADFFDAVVGQEEVRGAMVSTADALCLGLCLERSPRVHVHTWLYEDLGPTETYGFDDMRLDLVAAAELGEIARQQSRSLEQDPGDWLDGYLRRLVERGELFALRSGDVTLGTGEIRVSDSQPPHADLGVITFPEHRRRGVATLILKLLKQQCYERSLLPICSTTVENVGSRKAIERAGFASRHRLLQITFQDGP